MAKGKAFISLRGNPLTKVVMGPKETASIVKALDGASLDSNGQNAFEAIKQAAKAAGYRITKVVAVPTTRYEMRQVERSLI